MSRTIEVLSPVGERRTTPVVRAPGLASLAGARAGLLDNNKSNTETFLRLLARDLGASWGVRDVVTVAKQSAGRPAAPEDLERLRGCDFVVTAFAD